VVIHPSLSKSISTRNARAFWDGRIAGLHNWIKAAKDTILAAEVFSIVLSFFILFKVESQHRMIRSIVFAKSKQENG